MQETLKLDITDKHSKKSKSISVQNLINWFVFFLAFPALSILGNSITFYIFIAIVIKVGSFWKKKFKGKALFLSFVSVIIVSTILAPYSKMDRHPGIFSSLLILIQYIYWILVASFFIAFKNSINYFLLSKWLFYGTVSAILGFFVLRFNLNLSIIEITLRSSRNAFIFTLLCTIPICFHYLQKKRGALNMIFYFLFFLFIMLFTNGRSGAIIIIIQLLLIASIIYPNYNRIFKFSIIPFLAIFFSLQTDNAQIYLNTLANQVQPINPRVASLLRQEGEGDLTADKSWLLRKLMVDKGNDIAKEFPVLGVGPNNFIYFDTKFSTINQYDRLQSESKEFYNSRSAHNSYIQTLSELGYSGLLLLVFIIGLPMLHFFRVFWLTELNLHHLPLISLLGISIHFYAISSLTGAIPWMIFGLAWASTLLKRREIR